MTTLVHDFVPAACACACKHPVVVWVPTTFHRFKEDAYSTQPFFYPLTTDQTLSVLLTFSTLLQSPFLSFLCFLFSVHEPYCESSMFLLHALVTHETTITITNAYMCLKNKPMEQTDGWAGAKNVIHWHMTAAHVPSHSFPIPFHSACFCGWHKRRNGQCQNNKQMQNDYTNAKRKTQTGAGGKGRGEVKYG